MSDVSNSMARGDGLSGLVLLKIEAASLDWIGGFATDYFSCNEKTKTKFVLFFIAYIFLVCNLMCVQFAKVYKNVQHYATELKATF